MNSNDDNGIKGKEKIKSHKHLYGYVDPKQRLMQYKLQKLGDIE